MSNVNSSSSSGRTPTSNGQPRGGSPRMVFQGLRNLENGQAQEIHDDASVATQVTDNTIQGIARRQAQEIHDDASVLDKAKTSEIKENKSDVLDEILCILKNLNQLANSDDAEDKKFIDESLKPDLKALFQTVRDKKTKTARDKKTKDKKTKTVSDKKAKRILESLGQISEPDSNHIFKN